MSDNELDAELLALAGDDSSDDERTDNRAAQRSSPFEHAALSSEPDRSPPRRGLAQKPKSRSSAAASRRRRKDDSEEEGEASPASSPRSLGSAAMDESDSEDGVDFDQAPPLYPIEGKFKSEEDRKHVMAMTEIDREETLADRAAEVERRVQDLQLKKILQQRKREQAGADKKKRKAAAADLDDEDQRKSSRPKVKATSGPLEAYKREREMKGQQRNREDDRRRDRSPSRDDADSDRDADGDSEVEWDEKPRVAASREEAPATLRDFERARIGRTNFARVCFYPTFDSSVRNCYARVSIGVNRDTGAPQYRMAQIKGFTSGKPYQMEGLNGKPFVTDQYAVVAHGKAEKEWPFVACSDSSFTETEFERFKAALSTDSLRLPSKKALVAKLDDIHSLLEYQWTDEDIQRKINRTNALQSKFANYGREKIEKRREEAASRGDDTTVAKCDAELAALGSGSGAAAAKAAAQAAGANGAKATGKLAQQERLAALNRANRKANTEDIRKAQLAEKRVLQKAREEAAAKARSAAEAAKAKTLAVPDDLFGDASDISRSGTPANGAISAGNSTPIENKLKKTTLGAFKKKPKDEDIIADMDLGIDIDI
ncbi:hypothetical protein E4T39_01589 [Aureobasidium subglaciale]|nr:hypothetical protein E4T39_01589 [Aureobasidium subglaciale]